MTLHYSALLPTTSLLMHAPLPHAAPADPGTRLAQSPSKAEAATTVGSGRRQGGRGVHLLAARARAQAPIAVTNGPRANRTGGHKWLRDHEAYLRGGGTLHRPLGEAASWPGLDVLLAYALQVYREPPPPGLSVRPQATHSAPPLPYPTLTLHLPDTYPDLLEG